MMLVFSKSFGCVRALKKPVGLLVRNWHKEPIQVAWEKPDIGWTKLNFDGSCKCKTGRASIGGVLRNHDAEFLLGYSEFIGQTNSTIAELVALQRGLELVLENGWRYVWVEGDSKSLVEIIAQKKQVRCAEVQKHVGHINSMIPALKNCILTHVYREGNRAADKFAQMGYHLKKPQIWHHNPPKEVLRIVQEDAQGKTFLRRR
ncbi:hypothetical protein ACH5RR_017772 [Cinchona calisaya]|uniref:RNase H type-1 domain-containing protein n=1 Tax=Cinchona calisaya TaxID=153742 RepID=A0ABD2ZKU8_9GENT